MLEVLRWSMCISRCLPAQFLKLSLTSDNRIQLLACLGFSGSSNMQALNRLPQGD